MNRVRLRPLALGAACVAAASCINIFEHVVVEDVRPPGPGDTVLVRSPVKAHLGDGSTIVYQRGVRVAPDELLGPGERFALGAAVSRPVTRVPLDSVAAMESFGNQVDAVPTVLASTVATAGGVFVVALAAAATFGSCPTFYTDSAGQAVLEAEGFSYSIAPLFERRDVDRLRATTAADGSLAMEVRNEALETHYLNHIELLEVRHAGGEMIVPDGGGRALLVGALRPLAGATDRAGRDVSATLRDVDGVYYATPADVVDAAREDDLTDHLDLRVPAPSGADSVAVVLRLRNSLLNTVLLYDEILGASGAAALDWMGRDMQRIANAVELGQWYSASMGMRVSVDDGTMLRPVSRLGDVGPIALADLAVVVPTFGRDTVAVRLSFTADNWRIDRVAAGTALRRPAVRVVPAAVVRRDDGTADDAALASLAEPDERYLVTTPGQHFTVRFTPDPVAGDSARTFLLASQGYYLEWVRGDWLRTATRPGGFVPHDGTILAALRRWRAVQPEFERQFHSSRVPVR